MVRPAALGPQAVVLPPTHQSFDLELSLRDARDAFERAYFEYHLAKESGSMTRVWLRKQVWSARICTASSNNWVWICQKPSARRDARALGSQAMLVIERCCVTRTSFDQ